METSRSVPQQMAQIIAPFAGQSRFSGRLLQMAQDIEVVGYRG